MKVVIDCNVFVMAVSSKSPYHIIITALKDGKFYLHLSTEILLEIEEKIKEKYRSEVADVFIDALQASPFVVVSEPFYRWNIISVDEDDNKYVDCYIKSNADFLVTNDRHFELLKKVKFPQISCITIDEFVSLITA